ncbi:hypothetical protein HPB52_010802 [Rhipicephalus sanguineus]|uniref:Mediator of RNA polymerase II transcription subunit 30 n=1 Tax=Rhipicephalus sanguineus TaxID=34632 RepID=A0A9D4T3E2_RHISA|nr:hypothetical protein HPB52_010802 [Rhipicephalus sanguineus]
MQPPTGVATSMQGQEERRIKLQETLRNVGLLFRKLHRVHGICSDQSAAVASSQYTPIEPDVTLQSLVPMMDDPKPSEEKKPSEATRALLEERARLTEPTTAHAFCICSANHSSHLSYIAAALAGSRVAIAAITTDRECFVGGVHFPMASVKKRKNTVANYFRKAGFVTAELAETGEDSDEERIDVAFCKLSSLFPAAVPPEVSADDFVEADCSVQALASLADKDIVAAVAGTQDAQVNSSSGDEDRPDEAAATHAYFATEVAAALGLICRCCGDMEGTGLSHLDNLDKIEASVFNFISKTKKQAKISDFFSRK